MVKNLNGDEDQQYGPYSLKLAAKQEGRIEISKCTVNYFYQMNLINAYNLNYLFIDFFIFLV